MNNIDGEILQALQTAALAAFDAATINRPSGWQKATHIKPVGITLTPPASGGYIEFVHIVNNGSDEYWDETQFYQGGFRLLLHWPMTDQDGPYAPMKYLSELAGKFSKSLQYPIEGVAGVFVRLTKNPSASGPIENGSELLFPLTLSYRCFRP